MLTAIKLEKFLDLVKEARTSELAWMNGYITALLGNSVQQETNASEVRIPVVSKKITITYGTETGNSKRLAADLAARAKKNGVGVKLVSLEQYRLHELEKEDYFFTIISTHGDGEPPDAAKRFYDHIHQNGFRLDKLKYGVLALGDTSYPQYCKAGEDVDLQLNKLGASRITGLYKCDIDYEEAANEWFGQVLDTLNLRSAAPVESLDLKGISVKKPSGKKIYKGTILANINLNDQGSDKQTHHIEITADELEYAPGDAISIILLDESGKKLIPRLYSIASSQQQFENEVHITVVRNSFLVGNELKFGLCSDYLCRLNVGDSIEFSIHKNNVFKLPAAEHPVIMIGPGTGIAPFRAFLQERDSISASGKNWLFFGDRHFETDFLYQSELLNWFDTGLLDRLNVAFSRDQQEKLYVQHRMIEHARELYQWLQDGAYFYVCGAKDPMSIDVENTLLKILDDHGEDGFAYLNQLKEEGRYLKDVY